jgi:Tol biopolymer transport system component
LDRGTLTRLTFAHADDGNALWSPDGTQVAFGSNRYGQFNLYSKPVDGSGEAIQLTDHQEYTMGSSWSPDGTRLAFQKERPEHGSDIWMLPLDGEPEMFLGTPFDEGRPAFSPDGRWLAYDSDESGRTEVYVLPYPGQGGKVQVSAGGGRGPLWARSGRELFYRNGNKMMAVAVSTEPELSLSKPEVLFERPYRFLSSRWQFIDYDVAPDGEHFVMVQEVADDPGPSQLNVVLNWFEELKRLAPTE